MPESNIKLDMRAGRRAYLAGIGGVSMSALAEILQSRGLDVRGSDSSDSPVCRRLRSLGIGVAVGHEAGNLGCCDFVVRTAAVHDDNPEIIAARERGIPVYERAEAVGALMTEHRRVVCIAGTHGKTSTSSMLAQICVKAAVNPTVMIGGTLPLLGAGHRVGSGDIMVTEACEYANSFLSFFPHFAVITNVEADHLDFFKDLEEIESSFRSFALRVPAGGGFVIYNGDDPGACRVCDGLERPLLRFSTRDSSAGLYASELMATDGRYAFDAVIGGRVYARVRLRVPGMHNVQNALAAVACAYKLGIEPEHVENALAEFGGAGRRFEYIGEYNGASVYDDYAHHPTELKALIASARLLAPTRLILAFQPHTYTRTAALMDDFAGVLCGADIVLLSEIYAAREADTGLSARALADRIPGAEFFGSFDESTEYLRKTLTAGDMFITVGAGDVYKIGSSLLGR